MRAGVGLLGCNDCFRVRKQAYLDHILTQTADCLGIPRKSVDTAPKVDWFLSTRTLPTKCVPTHSADELQLIATFFAENSRLFYGISSYHWAQTRTFDRSFAASSVLWRFSTIFFSEMLMFSKKTKRTKKKDNRKYSATSTKMFGFQISRGNRALQSCRQPKIFEAWAFPPFCLFPLGFSPFMLFFAERVTRRKASCQL